MRELLPVEYVSFTGIPKQKDQRLALDGCLGEVDRHSYQRAVRAFRAAVKAGASTNQICVSVRFPLNMPMTDIGFYPNWGFSRNDVDEQGIAIPVQNLRLSKKPLISSYTRAPWPTETMDILNAFEAPVYYETRSLPRLINAIARLQMPLPHGWVWVNESQTTIHPLLFQGARFYGADNLIQVYANNRFKGLAVQIFTRDLLHGYHQKMASDILLLTSTTEYVEYLDGETILRNRINGPLRYFREALSPSRVMTAKGITPLLRKQNMEKPVKPTKNDGSSGTEWSTISQFTIHATHGPLDNAFTTTTSNASNNPLYKPSFKPE